MAFSKFEEAVNRAIDEKVVANATVIASSKDFRYEKAFGKLDFGESSPPVTLESTYHIFSCTKLVTSIAVLQCVERGQVTLDSPISTILPEWHSPPILDSINPVTKEIHTHPAKTPITLRHLLTHTSGMGYDFAPPLSDWIALQPPAQHNLEIKKQYLLPLVCEPGEEGKWHYSVGLDWAGQMVERLNGGVRLGAYMQEHIFAPLGLKDTTFRPMQREDIVERKVPLMLRGPDGSVMRDTRDASPMFNPADDLGGAGLVSTASDYHKILESIVRDDGKLLKCESIDELFRPQLPEHPDVQAKLADLRIPFNMSSEVPGGSAALKWNHGLGGVVTVDGIPAVAGKGTMWWDGASNCYWFIDRQTGTCAFYGSQMLPPADSATQQLVRKLMADVMREAKK